jgi:hypothetical protein
MVPVDEDNVLCVSIGDLDGPIDNTTGFIDVTCKHKQVHVLRKKNGDLRVELVVCIADKG